MQHFVFILNWSLERYSAEHNGADNFLSSFIFLLASYFSLVLVLVNYTKGKRFLNFAVFFLVRKFYMLRCLFGFYMLI